jgi:TolB-like protein
MKFVAILIRWRTLRSLGAAALLVMLTAGLCAAGPAGVQALPGVVVWDFEDQTPTALASTARVDYLRRALSENLTATLLAVPGLPVVERQRLQDVLAEQKLSAGALADEDTRLRLGHVVGAGRMVFGSFFALGDQVQVNLRLIDTATSRVLFADELSSPAEGVMQRVDAVNRRLVLILGGADTPVHRYRAELWHAYDEALSLSDAGQYDQAIEMLQRLLARDKDFSPAERQLVALLDKMSRR